jgi:hypothetical protein
MAPFCHSATAHTIIRTVSNAPLKVNVGHNGSNVVLVSRMLDQTKNNILAGVLSTVLILPALLIVVIGVLLIVSVVR